MTYFGIAFNPYRNGNKIPLLPDSFVLNRYGLDFVGWKSPLDDSIMPRYDNKLVTWDSDDSLIEDRSAFVGPGNHVLVIWYGKREKNLPYHFGCGFLYNNPPGEFSRSQADSILRAWHLNKW
jgi:hypothetical protein